MSNIRNDTLTRYADMFRALSNPNRLQIFLRLVDCCGPGEVCSAEEDVPTCVGEVGRDLGLAPSTISHHLKELRGAGLIQMERQGQKVVCSVEPAVLQELAGFFGQQ